MNIPMMSMFEDIKRPRAEMKVINQFITEYTKAKDLYKKKNYSESLDQLEKSFDILTLIYDKYPKVEVLYYLMKVKFHLKQYPQCITTKNKLQYFLSDIEDHKNKYPKFKAKMFLYEVLISYTQNLLKESIQYTLEMIDYVKGEKNYTLEEKIEFFWCFLLGILKQGNIHKTKKYELFKKEVDIMVVDVEDEEGEKKKMIKTRMKDLYKNFMSTKIRKFIFDDLNEVFFQMKYNQNKENKVVSFLDKKMHICVRDNNMQKLLEIFQTYLHLNKIKIKDYFGNVTMKTLVNEQKCRIETFETIYGNLCGAFNIIFEPFFTDNYIDPLINDGVSGFSLERKKSLRGIKRTFSSALASQSNLTAQAKEIFEQIKKNASPRTKDDPIIDEEDFPLIKKSSTLYRCADFDFAKDIYIPPNNSDKLNANDTVHNNTTQNKEESSLVGLGDRRLSSLLHPQVNSVQNSVAMKTQYSIQSQNNTVASVVSSRQPSYPLRNVNTFLMNILIKQFSKPLYLKRSDLLDIKIPTYIKSNGTYTSKGTSNGDNQDISFIYENFLLIKNFTVLGVCDGHGKYGKNVSEGIKSLFPSYMHYLTMDNNLIKREEDINEIIISLFKLEERPEVKDLNIIRYFYKKFEMIYKYIPFIKHNFSDIKQDITEAIYRTHLDLKERLKIDTENSGATMCALLFYGNTLFVSNVGDSRAIMGSYIFEENRWDTKQISFDHKPEDPQEKKRILVMKGRIEKWKDEKGDLVGPYRVWFKPSDSTGPGLAMSRSIGDTQAKKIGVTYEPDLYEYTLNGENKFIVVGTDGLWDNLTNEEVVNIVSEYYELKDKAENAAKVLVEKAKEKIVERNKDIIPKKRIELNPNLNTNSSNENNANQPATNEPKNMNIRSDDITCWVVFLDVKDN